MIRLFLIVLLVLVLLKSHHGIRKPDGFLQVIHPAISVPVKQLIKKPIKALPFYASYGAGTRSPFKELIPSKTPMFPPREYRYRLSLMKQMLFRASYHSGTENATRLFPLLPCPAFDMMMRVIHC